LGEDFKLGKLGGEAIWGFGRNLVNFYRGKGTFSLRFNLLGFYILNYYFGLTLGKLLSYRELGSKG